MTKVGRVLADLVGHPRHILPYLKSGPMSAKSPLELGLPWFSLTAIRFLQAHLSKNMHAFEYGSGGSTVFLAERVASVISTEDNQAWLDRVRLELSARDLKNVELQDRPYDFKGAANFDESDYLHSIPDRLFDVIIVDGAEEGVPVRPRCFFHAEKKVKPGGIIVVDDSWRYPELRSTHHAKSFEEFRSIGPCRPGVTSTDVYLY